MGKPFGRMKFGRPYIPRHSYHMGRWATVLLVVFTLIYVITLTASQASRTMERVAEKKLEIHATRIINSAVKETLDKGLYGDLVSIDRSSEGRVLSVSAVTGEMNRLKYNLTDNILNALESEDNKRYCIPLGALTDMLMLSGLGPDIPFDILPYGGARVDYRTAFTSAGVNQTLCEIYVDITLDLYAVSPTLKVGTTVTTSVVAERTIIVGEVPRYFAGNPKENTPKRVAFSD